MLLNTKFYKGNTMDTEEKKLNVEQSLKDNILTVKLTGWLDPNTSPLLLEEIKTDNIAKLIFDMKNVEYVFSAGLRAFLIFQKQMDEHNGQMQLINVSDQIRLIFEYAGFESMLEPKK